MTIKANAATDLLIAKACGMPRPVVRKSPGSEESCYVDRGQTSFTRFSPTRNWNHAMEAALSFFRNNPSPVVSIFLDKLLEIATDRSARNLTDWAAARQWKSLFEHLIKAGPIAICEAILATAKGTPP